MADLRQQVADIVWRSTVQGYSYDRCQGEDRNEYLMLADTIINAVQAWPLSNPHHGSELDVAHMAATGEVREMQRDPEPPTHKKLDSVYNGPADEEWDEDGDTSPPEGSFELRNVYDYGYARGGACCHQLLGQSATTAAERAVDVERLCELFDEHSDVLPCANCGSSARGNDGALSCECPPTPAQQTRYTSWVSERSKLRAEVAELAQHIRNIVARIDRDGGHRQQGESLAESVARAHLVAAELLAERDALEHKLVEWRSMHAAYCVREATWQRLNDTLRVKIERLRRLGAIEHPDAVQRACEAFADIDDEPKKEMGDV